MKATSWLTLLLVVSVGLNLWLFFGSSPSPSPTPPPPAAAELALSRAHPHIPEMKARDPFPPLETTTDATAKMEALAECDARRAALEAKLSQLQQAHQQVSEELAELREPLTKKMLSSVLLTPLKKDEILVTVGFENAEGRRLYTFIDHEITEFAKGSSNVTLRSRVIAVEKGAGEGLGLETLHTGGRNVFQHGEIWNRAAFDDFNSNLSSLNGVELMSAPSVMTRPGQNASVYLGTEAMRIFSVHYSPELLPDGSGVNLEVRLGFDDPRPEPAIEAPLPAASQE
ncbi:MAG: hypothetical protein ACFBZ8_04060 [Opitutales bacterium]